MTKIVGTVPAAGGLVGHITAGGIGGTKDHSLLANRDKPDQHPIEAITGLRGSLDTIPPAAEALTNEELEALLK